MAGLGLIQPIHPPIFFLYLLAVFFLGISRVAVQKKKKEFIESLIRSGLQVLPFLCDCT